jgi:hypothetical protein
MEQVGTQSIKKSLISLIRKGIVVRFQFSLRRTIQMTDCKIPRRIQRPRCKISHNLRVKTLPAGRVAN